MKNHLIKESYYDKLITQWDSKLNEKTKWRKNVLLKSVSSYITSDPKRKRILEKFQDIFVNTIDQVTKLRNWFNFTVK